MHDLHDLPKFRDGLSYLYVEHCRVDQEAQAIAIHDAAGVTPVPAASLALLMLGPGTRITHAAIKALADNGCLAVWCGEAGVRFYAAGFGETRDASRLLEQARLCLDGRLHMEVVWRMYQARFPEPIDTRLTIQQIRGMEGVRVRSAYQQAARRYGVEWKGRSYDRGAWGKADPVNRALSAANACLYGICHAAILSAGFSPAIGFIHTGKQLSFVYDVADLYKTEFTIPVAFEAAAKAGGGMASCEASMASGEASMASNEAGMASNEAGMASNEASMASSGAGVASSGAGVDRAVRLRLRDLFRERRLLQRILPDVEFALGMRALPASDGKSGQGQAAAPGVPQGAGRPDDYDADPAAPAPLWTPAALVQSVAPELARPERETALACADGASGLPDTVAPPPEKPNWPSAPKPLEEEIKDLPW